MPTPQQDKIIFFIMQERSRQNELKQRGDFPYTCADTEMLQSERLAVLVEEVGEVSRALLNAGQLSNDSSPKELRTELIQCAAICIAWLESLYKPDIF